MKSAKPADFTVVLLFNWNQKLKKPALPLLPPAPCSHEDRSPPAAGEDGTCGVLSRSERWKVEGGGNGGGVKWRSRPVMMNRGKDCRKLLLISDCNDFIGLFWCLGCCERDRLEERSTVWDLVHLEFLQLSKSKFEFLNWSSSLLESS